MAQEVLSTFSLEMGEVTLIPGTGGIFEIRLDGQLIWERKRDGGFPDVKQLKQILRAFGAMGALMTGSGASVFGVFASSEQQRNAEQALRRHYPSFLVLKA